MSHESTKRLRDLLEDPRLKEALIKQFQRERTHWDEGADEEAAGLPERIHRDAFIIRAMRALRELFESSVLSKLPDPKGVTAEDLETALFNRFVGVSGVAALDGAYGLFVEHVLHLPYYESFQVGDWGDNVLGADSAVSDTFNFGCWTPQADEVVAHYSKGYYGLWDSDPERNPWSEEIGFSFVVGWGLAEIPPRKSGNRIEGYLEGRATRAAFDAAEQQFRLFIPSILRSYEILDKAVSGKYPGYSEDNSRELSYPRLISSELGQPFFSACISGYFGPRGRKGEASIQHRIGNAVRLLVEADSQRSSSIALALCFAAIEALVCSHTHDNISKEVSRNVAAALEPHGPDRPSVIDEIRNLYGKRSKALHGEYIEDDETVWLRTRVLAAGVLGAAIEWLGFQRGMGDKEEQREFVSELRKSADSGTEFIVDSKKFRRCLPTSA